MVDDADMRPAIAAWCGLLALAGGLNVWLIRNGHRPLTDVARTDVGRAVHRYLDGHFDQRLGRFDVLSLAGSRIPLRR